MQGDCLQYLQWRASDIDINPGVDHVLGSPPYPFKGERYAGGRKRWSDRDWACWMHENTRAAAGCCSGYVVWIVNNPVRDRIYRPAVERLIIMCDDDPDLICERPAIWHKNATPNRKDWFSNDWEYCVAFRAKDSTPYFDTKALGQAPKYSAGGDFRQRDAKGNRRKGGAYPTGKIVGARDVIRATVGGGHMGSKLAHENEAPYPESLVLPFILCCCPPGGTVLDPFCGSGTTLKVAEANGRKAIGVDFRESQVELSKKRMLEVR
jgi:DNA modification methylase